MDFPRDTQHYNRSVIYPVIAPRDPSEGTQKETLYPIGSGTVFGPDSMKKLEQIRGFKSLAREVTFFLSVSHNMQIVAANFWNFNAQWWNELLIDFLLNNLHKSKRKNNDLRRRLSYYEPTSDSIKERIFLV